MPSTTRYARYREDQTTIWVSKTAAAFLVRERGDTGAGTATVLDRLLSELRRLRRAQKDTAPAPRKTTGAGAARKATVRGKRAASTRR